MSDIERFVTIWGGGGMMPASSGDWVRYDDHRAEVERVKNAIDHLTSERGEARPTRSRVTSYRRHASGASVSCLTRHGRRASKDSTP